MRLRSKLAAVAAMVAAMMVVLPGASTAAQSYTITAGGQTSPTPLSYGATASPLHFSVPGVPLSCGSSTAAGVLHLGDHATGENVGTIENTTWVDCLGPLDIPLTFEQTEPSSINIVGPAGSVTEGYLGDVAAHVSATDDPGLCSFDVTGQAHAYFDEATQTFVVEHTPANADKVNDPLTIRNAVGCFDLVHDDDPVYTSSESVVSNDLGPIDIS